MTPPRATYRLQFTRDFGFEAAARIAPYLASLGVSHVYASPWLQARPGSTHGYDIVRHDLLNPELGNEAAFRAMNETFARHGLKQILDFVPNHMGVGGADNPFWLEVLEWGPLSPFAGWFDIDWEPANRYLTEKLLVPVLADQYGAVLEDGELVLKFDAAAGEFAVWAYDHHKLPVCPMQYATILGDEHAELERLGDEFGALLEWKPQMERRADELKRELASLVARDSAARTSLDRALARLNGAEDVTRPELDDLIQAQYWRASHFRVAGDDINYRRFFNVNDLAGIRIELSDVFEHAHRLVFKLLDDGVLDGLRIDHVDGLLDPKGYLQKLRERMPSPRYLVVEKILGRTEALPGEWPVDGTTGYEFNNLVTHLLIDARGEAGLTRAYREFTGERRAFADVVRDCKIRIMENEMASELHVLARDAARVARQNPQTADFTRHILQRAIRELIASFPVYRTYLNADGSLAAAEMDAVRCAVDTARCHEREIDPSVFEFLETVLTGAKAATPRSGFSRHSLLRCAMKLQQYSGPVMAKGFEDTALYRFNRLLALNEVGGFPDHFGVSIAQFHALNIERARKWPRNLLSTATHDTKRGEDARARLIGLAEIPDEWFDAVRDWNLALRDVSAALNDANAEYFLYQTLLASWPADGPIDDTFRERLRQGMLKSMREAKLRTSWTAPDCEYEHALMNFINAAVDRPSFLDSFLPFQQRIARLGLHNSLVQTTLKLTVPGVPDTYQGSEIWDLNLVDPDNRRPVDYDVRQRLLDTALQDWRASAADALRNRLDKWQDGAIKLLITALLLKCRAQLPGLFADGDYQPCEVSGEGSERICAFMRTSGDARVLVIAALFPETHYSDRMRFAARLRIAPEYRAAQWIHVLSERRVPADEWMDVQTMLGDLPIAVLYGESHVEAKE
jgi:(1->4)-alpha-D-glucan 1-alpha-D-glucosylmutase